MGVRGYSRAGELCLMVSVPFRFVLTVDSFSAWKIFCSSRVLALMSSAMNTQPEASRTPARSCRTGTGGSRRPARPERLSSEDELPLPAEDGEDLLHHRLVDDVDVQVGERGADDARAPPGRRRSRKALFTFSTTRSRLTMAMPARMESTIFSLYSFSSTVSCSAGWTAARLRQLPGHVVEPAKRPPIS